MIELMLMGIEVEAEVPIEVRYRGEPVGDFRAEEEAGRTELLRSTGVSYAQLEGAGVFLVIVKLDVRYRRPVLYDDVVEVRPVIPMM